jgi:hypothetical protein
MNSDFKAELRAEIMEETRGDISSEVEKAMAGSTLLSGMFKGTTVSGFIDTNYTYNLRNHGEAPFPRENANGYVNFLGENDDNTFVLENFALFLDKEATDEHPIGWQMHTYWGEKAKRITFLGDAFGAAGGSDDTARNDIFTLATANVTWNAPVLGKTVPITMGKMYTWIGYELVENIGNPNYSHGMVYNNAIPFTHMGISFDVSEFLPSDKLGLTLYYVNGWDSFIDNNESKSYGFYATYTPNDDFFFSLAGIYGNEGWNKRVGDADPSVTLPAAFVGTADNAFGGTNNGGATMMYDIVITYSLPQVDKLSLGFNWDHGYSEDFVPHNDGTVAHFLNLQEAAASGFPEGTSLGVGTGLSGLSGAHWWAAVGYAMYDFTDNQMGALRYEYFDDQDGVKAFGHSMWSLTYTQNMTVRENLMLRPEIRYNSYNIPDAEEPGHGDKGNTFDSEFILQFGAEYVF